MFSNCDGSAKSAVFNHSFTIVFLSRTARLAKNVEAASAGPKTVRQGCGLNADTSFFCGLRVGTTKKTYSSYPSRVIHSTCGAKQVQVFLVPELKRG